MGFSDEGRGISQGWLNMKTDDSAPIAPLTRRYNDSEDAPRRLKFHVVSILTILMGLFYMAWAVYYHNPEHAVVAWLYLFSEAFCLWLFILSMGSLWRLRFKPETGLRADKKYSIDIFVPTCHEPIGVITKTLEAIKDVRWNGSLQVYVLDDGAVDEVQALTERLGFHYLSRSRAGVPRADAKGGNLNFGLAHSTGELILTMDADQVPYPDILEKLAGYMKFEKVAFVQSKQRYFAYDDDPFYNKSEVFYGVVQLAMDNMDTAMACGSGVLYRRAALEDIGGFAAWNLVEDQTTSYELHAKGWRSFYFNHPLSRGLSPTTIWGVYQQRGQWALDTMRIFFFDNPLFKKGLSFKNKIHYLTVAQSYIFSGFLLPFFFVLPVWTCLTGNAIFSQNIGHYLAIRGAYFFLMVLSIHYMCMGGGAGNQFRHLAGLFPVYFVNVIRALFYPKGKSKPGYRTNNSGNMSQGFSSRPAFLAVLPQILLMGANLVAPFYALWAETCPVRLIAGNAFLSAFSIWTLFHIVSAAIRRKQWAEGESPYEFYGIKTN
jgi:cellulose synthase (UDP-forming)